jgi:hypothetical protein
MHQHQLPACSLEAEERISELHGNISLARVYTEAKNRFYVEDICLCRLFVRKEHALKYS